MIDKLPAIGVISGVLASLVTFSVQAAVSYAPPVSTSVGTAGTPDADNPEYIAKGNLNPGGEVDLVTVNETDGTITVLLNDGAGGFSSVTSYDTVGSQPRQVAIGDIDGDGDNDLLVPNTGNNLANAVAVFLNNGDGSFAPALTIDFSSLGAGAAPTSPVIADFDGDANGYLDAAVSTAGTNQIQILLSNGNGTFTTGTALTTGAKPSYITAGDLNLDGNTDLVAANYDGASISVFLGDGAGNFTGAPGSPLATAARPWALHLALMDAGSNPDLVMANYSNAPRIRVLPGNGNGSFAAASSVTIVPLKPHGVEIADVNNDTLQDVVVASDNDPSPPAVDATTGVSVLLGDGAGGFSSVTSYPIAGQPNGVVALNLDDPNTSLIDLAVANASTGNVDVLLSVPTANAPVANDGDLNAGTDWGTANPVSGTLTGTDADGALLSYAITTPPTNGTVNFTNPAAGEYTYTPNTVIGTDSFQFTVDDGTGPSPAATIQVVQNQPVITSNGGGATAAVSVPENQTAVTTVTATDADAPPQTLTFSISGGADAAKFAINANSGVLTFVTAPDFETPTDQGGNNVYNVQVQVSDGVGGTATQDIAVTVTDVDETGANQPPTITSDGGGASAAVTVSSGQTAVTTVTATDPDAGQTLTYSISGGADATQFTIDASSGALSFVTAPDVANPTDANVDNVYDVQVEASDSSGGAATQDIAVTVTEADTSSSDGGNGGGCALHAAGGQSRPDPTLLLLALASLLYLRRTRRRNVL